MKETEVAGRYPVSFQTLEDLIMGHDAISIKYALTRCSEADVSRLAYELSVLNNIKGEMLCLVQEINKRVGYIDEFTSSL